MLELQAVINRMAEHARSNGFQVVMCRWRGPGGDVLDIPVFQKVADGLGLIAGQEMGDEQMIEAIGAMDVMLGEVE